VAGTLGWACALYLSGCGAADPRTPRAGASGGPAGGSDIALAVRRTTAAGSARGARPAQAGRPRGRQQERRTYPPGQVGRGGLMRRTIQQRTKASESGPLTVERAAVGTDELGCPAGPPPGPLIQQLGCVLYRYKARVWAFIGGQTIARHPRGEVSISATGSFVPVVAVAPLRVGPVRFIAAQPHFGCFAYKTRKLGVFVIQSRKFETGSEAHRLCQRALSR
jgi:hypothetical protein